MSRVDPERALMSSVLDRLLDDDPTNRQETPRASRQLLRELRAAVKRDLETLLNTRRRFLSPPKDLAELERSILYYGVPDPSGADVESEERRLAYLRQIESAIRRFEPRFKSVRVLPHEGRDADGRSLHFRIEAVLMADPAPEHIAFESLLEPMSCSFEIKA